MVLCQPVLCDIQQMPDFPPYFFLPTSNMRKLPHVVRLSFIEEEVAFNWLCSLNNEGEAHNHWLYMKIDNIKTVKPKTFPLPPSGRLQYRSQISPLNVNRKDMDRTKPQNTIYEVFNAKSKRNPVIDSWASHYSGGGCMCRKLIQWLHLPITLAPSDVSSIRWQRLYPGHFQSREGE